MVLSLRSQLARKIAPIAMSLLGSSAGLLFLGSSPAKAAEEVILTYGPIQETIAVEDFTRFAETGEKSSDLRVLLGYSGQDPAKIQQLLTTEVSVDFLLAHDILNNILGEYALFEMGNIIHNKSRRAAIQSLRGGILMSLQDDNRISLLEFFQNYPLQQMYVDGQTLVRVAGDVNNIITNVKSFLEVPVAILADLLGESACECEPVED